MAMTERYSELTLRIVFGIILAVLAVLVSWAGGLVFQLFAVCLTLIMFYEFVKICAKSLPSNIVVTALAFLLVIEIRQIMGAPNSVYWIAICAPIVVAIWEYYIRRSCWGALALVYCALTFIALVQLRGETSEGFFVILLIFAYVWGADSFAYIAGKTFGGKKLAPRLSPGKTWSGFFGGIFGALALSWLLMSLLGYNLRAEFFWISIIVIISSQIGDLFESGLKRFFDVKDSGNLIPGHGGLLDRVDGFVFAVVSVWLISFWAFFDNALEILHQPANAYLKLIVI